MYKKQNKSWLVVLLVVIMAVGLLGFNNFTNFSATTPEEREGGERVPCINPALPIPEEYHIHPQLEIIAEGKKIDVPANIGLGIVNCERAVHTHDLTGEIHIEPNFYQEFTLGDFFWVWEKPISRAEFLDYVADETHEIVMTVDGTQNDEFENLVLKDGQKIVLEYRTK